MFPSLFFSALGTFDWRTIHNTVCMFYAVALGSPKQAIKPQPSLVPKPLPPPPQVGGAWEQC